MEIPPPRSNFRVQVGNAVYDWHRVGPRSAHTRPDVQSSNGRSETTGDPFPKRAG
jgi:hypothetical protein